ncbi:MAG: AMP-binding protein [Bacteroidales bacterium]|nr:AMP-binding protein [Bacteroidales bacterium]
MEHYLKRFERTIRGNWDTLAIQDFQGEKFTFGQLAERVEKYHVMLDALGIKKGDHIALCAKNFARWGISFLAVNTYEAVVVPILYDFNPQAINSLVDHSEAVVLITDNDLWPKLDVAQMPRLKAVITINDFAAVWTADDTIKEICASTDALYAKKHPQGMKPEDVVFPDNNDGDLAVINYTSGTTSAPKGVMIRYESISSNFEFAQRRLPCWPGDTIVSMLPMAHMYGLMFEFIYPVCCGVTVSYLGKTPSPSLLLKAFAEVKPYIIITVPLVFEKIFKSKVLPTVSKPAMKVLLKVPGISNILCGVIRKKLLDAFGGKIRALVMGGAALNPEVEYWFKRFKMPFTVGYGMTEGAPLFAYESPEDFVPKSCGKVVTRVEARIDSPDPQNVVGEIQMKGVNVMSGYYKNPEATAAAFTEDGWLRTGDLGLIDKDGNIFIKGRSKAMILSSNGQNIYPEEIEAFVNNQPYVIESVVVGRKNGLVALVYLDKASIEKDGVDLNAHLNNCMHALNKQMPVYSKITKMEVVDEPFAKTPKMSIKRFLYN